MNKLFFSLIIPLGFVLGFVLLIPSISEAAIAVGWNATSTDAGYITPNPVNGSFPTIVVGTGTPSAVNANAKITIIGKGSQDFIASTTDNNSTSDAIYNAYAPGSRIFIGAHGTNQTTLVYGITSGGYGELACINSTFGTSNGCLIGTRTTAAPIIFGTNNIERFRIGPDGANGINLATPGASLEIKATTTTSGGSALIAWDSSGNPLIYVRDDGNIGIGTSSPWAPLSINTPTSATIYFAAGSTTANAETHATCPTPGLAIGSTTAACPLAHTLDVNGNGYFTSSGAVALGVGATGTSTLGFQVDQSAGVGTGISTQSAAAGSGETLQTLSANANEALTLKSKGSGNAALNSPTGGILLQPNNTSRYTVTDTSHTFTRNVSSTAATVRFSYTDAADAALTAGAEAPDVYFNLGSAIRTHASNTNIPTQRDYRLTGSTHAFATAGGTITNAAAFSIDAPDNAGTNAAISTSSALYIPGAALSANVSTSTAANFNASTGASNNFALMSVGRVLMNGVTQSSGLQSGIACFNAVGELINESIACVSSARMFKENIASSTHGLAEVLQLQPVTFTWKKDYLGSKVNDPNQNGTQYSLIADDVAKIDPNLVSVATAPLSFEGKTYPAGTVTGLADLNHWVSVFVQSFHDMETQIQGIMTHQSKQDVQIAKQQAEIEQLQAQLKKLEK